jgi:hypothetical protein
MFKQLIFSALSLLTIVSAVSLYSDSASAQDFYHRDSRERRRGDWRQGYGDGSDCTRMAMEVAEAICDEERRARGPRAGNNCTHAVREASSDPGAFVYQVGTNGWQWRSAYLGSGIRALASQAMNCRDQREGRFNDRVERESSQWHEREERREREARRQQEGTGRQSGPSEDDSGF